MECIRDCSTECKRKHTLRSVRKRGSFWRNVYELRTRSTGNVPDVDEAVVVTGC